jgi:uncharacterized protein
MPTNRPARPISKTWKPRVRLAGRHLRRQVPTKDSILATPFLQPVRPYISDDRLWALERHSVARGVAMGLFMGVLLPVAQILFAVAGAALVRGHIAISAACTLITNPLTVPPIYLLAYEIGGSVLPKDLNLAPAWTGAQHWLAQAAHWALTHGMPLMTGLLVLALGSSLLGFAAVHLLWRRAPAGRTSSPPG